MGRIPLALALAAAVAAVAHPARAGDAIGPQIARGKGEQCVEYTAFMRRNHMSLLRHQSDATMHEGIRTTQHSLKGCIECHAVAENGVTVGVDHPRHFCRSCHDFAAVQTDCFQCHADKPGAAGPGGVAKQ